MLQSTVSAIVPIARTARAPRTSRRTHEVVSLVTIDVTVPGTASAESRRALHSALGDDLRLYVMTIDRANERVTFRAEITARTLDNVIAALTTSLAQATLGRAVSSVLRRPRQS
ncbi:hypothetical protein [Paraburkholderia saeva]|jgi:hypothetical protein|uniref:Uncharacterized protein n=1 Tax=Paraburkholderia saeva TaxID=2777537 RepID=A0A9N8RVP2_9BURK|nr:hypothetical protein [Paraburkholderia saeva]CAG4894808.1 hypothetical protein LMG31841_01999 [Paraburkholderia saeva]CAG4898321.1 hypothetical protein R70241_02458 [Paraburkholderia saeva]